MFSDRLPHLESNDFSVALAELRRKGVDLVDLTVTNPTQVGLPYPPDLLASLADAAGLSYEPAPFGLKAARKAVAAEMSKAGLKVSSKRVVLTSSTSEAYSLLFKLLCDPGDCVLVPEPSYPLFELLTKLDAVEAVAYQLEHHAVWAIDRESMKGACGPRTRAVLVVSPNNPTGSMLRADDREWLVEYAQAGSYAIISDEVFADYSIVPRPDASSMLGESRVLTFTLGGLSKSAGLPQVKLGWIVVSGPDDVVADAMERLELMCDTYLSVSTPVQVAAAELIAGGKEIRKAIKQRVQQNYRALERAAKAYPSVRVIEPEGGWSAVIEVPETVGEEALVRRILDETHVVVHPGYFFDIQQGAHIVVSLLPPPDVFAEAMERVLDQVAAA
ncbi:MAG TPA: pyridoxal phosphate-dependent aminotransferase [Vicinamibacterales bacterium]|nr:pyridoxal phosphate-dependent aminotransferase [Vicinamibacterales bacterium]